MHKNPKMTLKLLFVCLCWFLRLGFSVYNPDYPRTHSVDRAGLELRKSPASVSQELGSRVYASMSGLYVAF